jgi:hypothetical protein
MNDFVFSSIIIFMFSIIIWKFNQFDANFISIRVNQRQEHEFVPDRMEYLKKISGKFSRIYCNGTATYFSYSNYGYTADISVKHTPCNEKLILADFHECPNLDIIISRKCPERSYAYDGSVQAPLREGDSVVFFGYNKNMRGWTGILGGPFETESFFPSKLFNGQGIINIGEYVCFGDQLVGHSGCLVLNSVGGVGVAHNFEDRMVGIVPIKDVDNCFLQLAKKKLLQTIQNCNTTIIRPPTLKF